MAIHSLKMLLFKDQRELDESTYKNLQMFGDYIACFYSVNWLLSPIAIQDLTFYLTMLDYSKNCNSPLQTIATAVNASLFRHWWYLTAEPYCLCSRQIELQELERITHKLLKFIVKI